jgi:tetratricopeptide (TPR) repeat protein
MLSVRGWARRKWLPYSAGLAILLLLGWYARNAITVQYLDYRLQAAIGSRDWKRAHRTLAAYPEAAKKTAKWNYLSARVDRRSGLAKPAAQALALARALGWKPADIRREEVLLKAQSGGIGEVEERLQEYTLAGADDQQAEEIYEATARGYMSALRIAEAIRCLKYWSEWQTKNALPHLWLGELHLRLENPPAAIAEFQEVLKRDPTHLEGRLKLADVRLAQLEIEKARSLYERCVEQDPDYSPALLGLAECQRRLGHTDEASRLFCDALTLELSDEQQALGLSAIGQIALENGSYSRAAQLTGESLKKNPNDPAVHLAFASALTSLDRKELAAKHRSIAKAISERHAKLVSVSRQAIQEPENAELRSEAGLLLLQQGMLAPGAQWLQSALQLDPQHPAAHQGLAQYYRMIGDRPHALQHERIAKQLDSSPSLKTMRSAP